MSRVCCLLLLSACGEPPAPVDHTARRAAFHAEVRERVGDRWNADVADVLAGADTRRGGEVYHKSCGNCHGTDLRGSGPRAGGMDPAPAPLVGSGRAPLPPAALIHIVTEGSPGTAMGPWGRAFPPDQIRDVVAYVWAQKAGAEAAD